MANETIMKIYEAEKSADQVEQQAKERGAQIVKAAQIKADEIIKEQVAQANEKAQIKMDEAKKKVENIIKTKENDISVQLDMLKQLATKKQSHAVDQIISKIV